MRAVGAVRAVRAVRAVGAVGAVRKALFVGRLQNAPYGINTAAMAWL